MLKLAKQIDDGSYAYLGMLYQCSSYFDVDIGSKCVKHIVDTYLQYINSLDFFEWIRSSVIIMDINFLKENFNDLASYSTDLETLQDLFMYLYDQEMWVDWNEKVLYTTSFTMSLKREKFNYVGIAMEFERLLTLFDKKIAEWDDIDNFIEIISYYGYDMDKDYKYRTNDIKTTIENIIERITQIFPQLGY